MLTIKEKSQIAFHHIANGDSDKAESIYSTVEKKEYVCTDFEFTSPLSCAILFSAIWGVEYWKNVALQSTANAKYFVDREKGNEVPNSVEMASRLAAFEARALAIDDSLVIICQAYGIYPDDVMRLASFASRYEPIEKNAKADQAYLSELVCSFKAAMNSWPGNAAQKSVEAVRVH